VQQARTLAPVIGGTSTTVRHATSSTTNTGRKMKYFLLSILISIMGCSCNGAKNKISNIDNSESASFKVQEIDTPMNTN
jgi:hypothetical protein